jgi:NhaA family Na+:H+ antiporter
MKVLIRKAINPLKIFISDSRSVGVLLIFCTALSLIISNSGDGGWYRGLWNNGYFNIPFNLPHSGLKWVNDFLMAFFFLLAGMEIKRELVNGELSSFKRAVLPFGAAFGGMVVPAFIFLTFNLQSGFAHGWGIPTATDIAFSLGIASLFGKRVPTCLKIFLMALAIIDDLGAIIVIALFYGGQIQWLYLLIAGLVYGLLWFCNYKKFKPGLVQFGLSLILWYMMLNAGIEASITGVLVAFAMPVSSLPKIENAIHKTVNFIILPLFALANTAILIPSDIIGSLKNSVSIGIIAGLVLGKPLGIFLTSKILVALKIAHLPNLANWKQFLGMGTLAGIGFTMSIFTTTLAFKDEAHRDIAKISILLSLVLTLTISWAYFLLVSPKVSTSKSIRTEPVINPEIAMG